VPPVDVEILGEERRRDHARAVVHEALGAELAHRRVNDRIAGAALGRRGERGVVFVPPITARAVVRPRGVRTRREHLGVEVAPAELAEERVGAGAAAERLLDLGWADAPEPQRGAHS
jgi:hypothetical protein